MSEGLAPDLARALYGTADPPTPRLSLRGGRLTAELVDGGIRRLAWNGVELVRGIAFLIRDEAWGTLPLPLGPPHVMQDDTRFSVKLQGDIAAEGAAFQFAARIEGDATGHFSVTVEGRPGADMVVNRAGFVILHPAHFGGLPVTLITVDGREIDDRFPEIISPGQPFFDLKGLRYALPGAGTVTCRCTRACPMTPSGASRRRTSAIGAMRPSRPMRARCCTRIPTGLRRARPSRRRCPSASSRMAYARPRPSRLARPRPPLGFRRSAWACRTGARRSTSGQPRRFAPSACRGSSSRRTCGETI